MARKKSRAEIRRAAEAMDQRKKQQREGPGYMRPKRKATNGSKRKNK